LTPQQKHSTQQTALLALSLVPGRLELLLRRSGLTAPVKHLDALPPCFAPTPNTLVLLDTAGLPPARLALLLTRLAPRQRGPHARLIGLVDAGDRTASALLACAGAPALQPRDLARCAGLLDHLMPVAAAREGLGLPFLEVYAALANASSIEEAAAKCGRSRSSLYRVLATGRAALGLPCRRGARPEHLAAEILDALERLAPLSEAIAPASPAAQKGA
jgi:hypothetical protein